MEIKEYSPTEAGLAEIAERMKGVVYDVTNTLGMAMAKRDRKELVSLRVSLETKRKELKAPALERSRLIDAEATRIKNQIVSLELPIDQQIKEEENRINAEKEAKRLEAQKRDMAIMEGITKLSTMVDRVTTFHADKINEVITFLEEMELTEEKFSTFLPLAIEAHEKALADITIIRDEKVKAEAEILRIEEERLAKLEEERIEREAEDKRIAEERLKLDAERKEMDEKIEAERLIREEEDRKRQIEIDKQQKILDEQKAKQDKKDAAIAEAKRIADEAEAKRIREEAATNEKLRKTAEKEQKKLARQKKLAEAKFSDVSLALQEILTVIFDEEISADEKLEQIQVIAEANI